MLTPHQYQKLKSIQLLKGTKAIDYDKNADLYKFFLRKGLIKRQEVHGYQGFVITPDGDNELYLYKLERYRFWLPTILSIIAILTSILAVFTQNGELWQILKELLQLQQ